MDQYFTQVQELYVSGVRNFLFLTVPPIQKTPAVMAQPNSTQSTEGAAVGDYIKLLVKAVDYFKAKNEGVTTWVYDIGDAFNTAIASPKTYGAKDASCYNGDGTSFLWFNGYHPGQAIHKLVAAGVAALVGP
jgi:phospholipase/lecithinase/hemolysin